MRKFFLLFSSIILLQCAPVYIPPPGAIVSETNFKPEEVQTFLMLSSEASVNKLRFEFAKDRVDEGKSVETQLGILGLLLRIFDDEKISLRINSESLMSEEEFSVLQAEMIRIKVQYGQDNVSVKRELTIQPEFDFSSISNEQNIKYGLYISFIQDQDIAATSSYYGTGGSFRKESSSEMIATVVDLEENKLVWLYNSKLGSIGSGEHYAHHIRSIMLNLRYSLLYHPKSFDLYDFGTPVKIENKDGSFYFGVIKGQEGLYFVCDMNGREEKIHMAEVIKITRTNTEIELYPTFLNISEGQ